MLGDDKLKYRMMWEALKDTAKIMIEDGIVGEVLEIIDTIETDTIRKFLTIATEEMEEQK